MTIESAKDKIKALLEKRGFTEKSTKEGLFTVDTGANKVGVELFGERPIVGVFINNKLEDEGHGIEAVFSLRSQVLAVWDREINRGASEQPAPKPELKIGCKHPTFQWQTPNRKVCMECGEDITPFASTEKEYEYGIKKPKPAEVVKPKGDEKMEMKKEEKALAIKEPEVTLSIDVIKQYICPTATDAEAFNFLQLCHYRQLNPFLKEAYLIKYGTGTASMVVGKDAFTRKAEESPAFDGYEAGIVLVSNGNFEDRIGTILKPKEELVGGWAKVYRKNTAKPFEVRVSLAEYDKKMNNWKSMPATMIRKVALVQALREAFTKELGGCYDATEIDPDAVVVEEKKQ